MAAQPKGLHELPPRWRRYIESLRLDVKVEQGLRVAAQFRHDRLIAKLRELAANYEAAAQQKGG